MLSRHFILPYRDYHYNHMPTLVLIYALLFKMTGYLLLAARTFSAVFAAGAAAIFYHVAYRQFASLGARARFWFALGVGVMFLANPIFTRTAGRAWNYDFPIFASLLAFVVMARGLSERKLWLLPASGLLIGLAVTTRLTFATELLPFAMFAIFYPGIEAGRKAALFLAMIAGFLVAILPSAWVWAQSPINAYFGNFQYPALNTQWHEVHDNLVHVRYTLAPKIWYFFKIIWELPGNGLLILIFVSLIFWSFPWRKVWSDAGQFQLLILLLLVVSQVCAGLVPSPPFVNYIYGATPFMLLAVIYCLGRVPNLATNEGLKRVLAGCLIFSLAFAIPEYRNLPLLFWPSAWRPVQAHRLGQEIAAATSAGPILTLDPIYVLEGGRDIYPALGTGCFGMRVGDFLTADRRVQYRMWGTSDIEQLFAQRPPDAVMISPGSDQIFENLFVSEARAEGYKETDLHTKDPAIFLWVPGVRAAPLARVADVR